MHERVKKTLRKYKMIQPGDNILIGLSGGADSVCLLVLLNDLKEEFDIHLYAVHVHHGLRGLEADRDADFSRQLCNNLNIPFYLVRRSIEIEAKQHKISVEAAGRKARYDIFNKLKDEIGANKIAVAHHLNDQVETVLFHLMRGSGLKGLGGIKPVRGDIIRPLIECLRTDIEDFCKNEKIDYVNDTSNDTNHYSRNKIRHNLIPYIEKNFNPSFIRQAGFMSDLLREDEDFLETEAKRYYETVKKASGDHKIILDAGVLLKLHPSIRKRIYMCTILYLCQSLEGYESKHLNLIDDLLFMQTGKRISLLDGMSVQKVYQEVHFSNMFEKGTSWEYILPRNNIVLELKEINAKLSIRTFNNKNTIKNGENRYTKWFDYDKIIFNLTLRNRRDGDFIYLNGSTQRKKLKDFFIDLKIPRDERNHIPLLADGSHVIWVIGYRVNKDYQVTEKTNKILEINFYTEEAKIE